MAFSYDKLWKLLIDKKMTKENFRILIKASSTTIAAMGKGEGISPKVLDRICTAFNCQPGDIMEHVPNTSSERGEIFQMTEYDFIKTVTVKIDNRQSVPKEEINTALNYLHALQSSNVYPSSKIEAMHIGGVLADELSKK